MAQSSQGAWAVMSKLVKNVPFLTSFKMSPFLILSFAFVLGFCFCSWFCLWGLAQTFRGLRLENFQFQFEVYLVLPCPFITAIIRRAIPSLSPPAFIGAPPTVTRPSWP
jgi:hypothetical protein